MLSGRGCRTPIFRAIVVGFGVFAIAAVAGCDSDGQRPNTVVSRTISSAPATTTDADVTRAGETALAAYRRYLAATAKASNSANPDEPDLRKYLADPLLSQVIYGVHQLKAKGAIQTGNTTSSPEVTSVNLRGTPPTVAIQDCIDKSDYRLMYKADHQPIPVTGLDRYRATATVTRYDDGRWLVNAATAHRDQSC
jgi:hypothetical protein